MLDRLFSGDSYVLASARLSRILDYGFDQTGEPRVSKHEGEPVSSLAR